MRERTSRLLHSNGFRNTDCVALMPCYLLTAMQMVRVYARFCVTSLIFSRNLAMNGLDDLRGMSRRVGDCFRRQVI